MTRVPAPRVWLFADQAGEIAVWSGEAENGCRWYRCECEHCSCGQSHDMQPCDHIRAAMEDS